MNFRPFQEIYSIDTDISADEIRSHVHIYNIDNALCVVIRALGEKIAGDNDSESEILEKPYFRRSIFAINTLLSAVSTQVSRDSIRAHKTPLRVATEIGYAPLIPLLVSAGFTEDGGALYFASSHRNFEIVDNLLNANIIRFDELSGGKEIPLHAAAHGSCEENIRIVKRLIAAGANVNQKGFRNETALVGLACEYPEMIRTLVNAGADVNECCLETESGDSLSFPLHCAAAGNNALEGDCDDHGVECVNLLLSLGAKIDTVHWRGQSALCDAAYSGNLSTLKTLLAAGAHVNPQEDCDSAFNSPFSENYDCAVNIVAVICDYDTLFALFRSTADEEVTDIGALKILVAAGADFAALVEDEELSAAEKVRKMWISQDKQGNDVIAAYDEEVLDFFVELDDAANDLRQLDWFDAKRAELACARASISTMIFQRYRYDTATICIGLQSLALPALVTLAVINAWMDWHPHYHLVPMHKKWDLITGVKHFEMRECGKNKRKRN